MSISKNIARIKDEENLFRDMNSNAVLFANKNEPLEKRNTFLKNTSEDINNLKKEVSEMKETMSKILEILSNRENR
jgi:hypothetical protein